MSLQSSSVNTGSVVRTSSSAVSRSTRVLEIETSKTDTFWQDPANAKAKLCTKICKINGSVFVGISKFWLRADTNQWCPSKKGHIYLTPEQWRAFAQRTSGYTQAMNALEKQTQHTSSEPHSGMFV